MKTIMTSRYTIAQTAPIDSGLIMPSISYFSKLEKIKRARLTYMATFLVLLISTPFNPASINVFPSHLIRLYANANAIPLKASEAISGSPLPRKLLYRITSAAKDRERRLHVSALERLEFMVTL